MNWWLKNLVLILYFLVFLGFFAPVAAAEGISLGAITISETKCPSLPTANYSKYLSIPITNNTGEEKRDLWLSVEIKTNTSNGQWIHFSSASVGVLASGDTREQCFPFDTPATEVRVLARDGSASHLSPVVASKTKTLSIAATREKLKKNMPALPPEIKAPVVAN